MLCVRSGWRHHWGLLFSVGLYSLYNVVVPVSDHLLDVSTFFGYPLSKNYSLRLEISQVYLIGGVSLIGSYFLVAKWINSLKNNDFPFFTDLFAQKSPLLLGFLLVVWVLILFNIQASGISPIALFDPGNSSEKDILFSAGFFSPGLDLLTNCLPAGLFLLLISKPRFTGLWILLFVFWLAFSLLAGWRYRIILLILMVVGWGIRYWRWPALRILIAGALLFMGVIWLTLNRMAIAKRQFSLVTFHLSQFDFGLLTHELSNSRTFHASLQYIQEHNINRGGFTSWLEHIAFKFRPKSDFDGNERPKPWILTVTKAWIPPGWPYNPNPAVSQMEEFYLTFGWIGLVIGMCLMGGFVALTDFRTPALGIQALQVMCIALCFQWITRGFFLYQIQISMAVLLPFGVVAASHAYLRHARSHPT